MCKVFGQSVSVFALSQRCNVAVLLAHSVADDAVYLYLSILRKLCALASTTTRFSWRLIDTPLGVYTLVVMQRSKAQLMGRRAWMSLARYSNRRLLPSSHTIRFEERSKHKPLGLFNSSTPGPRLPPILHIADFAFPTQVSKRIYPTYCYRPRLLHLTVDGCTVTACLSYIQLDDDCLWLSGSYVASCVSI